MIRRHLEQGLVLALLLTSSLAEAQGIPVFDAANLAQNFIQAGQTVIMVTNQLLELTGLEQMILADDMTQDLSSLEAISTEASGLVLDLTTIQLQLTALLSLDSAPTNTLDLQQRLGDIRRLTFRVYLDALRIQTLLQSSLSALRHIVRLTEAIGDLVGNHQSNQTLVQLDIKLTVELAKMREQNAAFHRAQIIDRLTEPLVMESIVIINRQLMSDYP